jgi:hypothetical protein
MLLAVSVTGTGANAGTATVTLPQAVITSAGVFDLEDHLIRTLWSGRPEDRGPLSIYWDGRDDEGHDVQPQRSYVVKVLIHNVHYRWQGVIGNTSRDQSGVHVLRAYLPIHDMAFSRRGQGVYVVGYNERQSGIHRFRPDQPDAQDVLARDDGRRIFRFVTADADTAYIANVGVAVRRPGQIDDIETFVLALDIANGTEHQFAVGRGAGTQPGSEWGNVIDYDAEDRDAHGQLRLAASGIAVQRQGDILFVAHAGAGEIRLFNKHSGARIGRIAIGGAGDMTVAPDDSLWVLCRTGNGNVVRHLQSKAGGWVPDTMISGFIDPLALGVSPIDGSVVVADAGTDQLRAFDPSGALIWTLGRPEGYQSGGPEVTADRFGFEGGPTYVAFESDGSFWFGDPWNERNLHYSATRRYQNQIMYLPHTRVVAVDASDPRRVFSGFLEFAVDYTKPLAGAWHLVRNWSSGLDARYRGEFEGLQSVVTLPGGLTLGVVRRYDINRNELVQLTSKGLSPVGATIDFNTRLYADGSLRMHLIRGEALKIFARRLEGSGAHATPHWTDPQLLAQVPALHADDPYYHDVPFIPGINESVYPQSERGVILSFNPGKSRGFHLGGIDPAREGWLWRASPTGSWDIDPSGNLTPKDGRYDINQGVQYPGNTVSVAGRQVVYGYHGEGWRDGEADQWLHFYDDGLFVGQFGTPGVARPGLVPAEAAAGFAGNAFSAQLVTVNGEVYLWHNDESGHGGVHRWWLDGAAAIRELKVPISP